MEICSAGEEGMNLDSSTQTQTDTGTPQQSPVDSLPDGATETEEEVLIYINFPDFDSTTVITEATEIKLHGLLTNEPKCSIANLEFAGKHKLNLGM